MTSSLVLVLLAAAAVTAEDWCPGSNGQFTQADREVLLKLHNEFRSRFALGTMTANGKPVPQAANMEKMKWDCDLEREAQIWSESTDCVMKHSNTSMYYGENLARQYYTEDPTFWTTSKMAAWSPPEWGQKEYDKCEYTSHIYESQKGKTCTYGHATAMAWATSNRLGCGVQVGAKCGKDQYGVWPIFVVCRYSPRGNIPESEIYSVGTQCSKCRAGTNCETSTGLCTEDSVEETPTTHQPETTTTIAAEPTTTTESPIEVSTISDAPGPKTEAPNKEEVPPFLIKDILAIITGSNITKPESDFTMPYYKVVQVNHVEKVSEQTTIYDVVMARTTCFRTVSEDKNRIVNKDDCPIDNVNINRLKVKINRTLISENNAMYTSVVYGKA